MRFGRIEINRIASMNFPGLKIVTHSYSCQEFREVSAIIENNGNAVIQH